MKSYSIYNYSQDVNDNTPVFDVNSPTDAQIPELSPAGYDIITVSAQTLYIDFAQGLMQK